ncbi:MAG: glycosyltransferase [Bryobacteraceae bacterium]|jgi:GT2 family glycosyltransferase/glycosyltransferase involved in cell wall biosynthesis
MALLKRILRALPLLVLWPFLAAIAALALALADAAWKVCGERPGPAGGEPQAPPRAASVVIPNWNGRELLEKYLPSVVEALASNAANEIVVVDNGSTDGSAAFVKSAFPQVAVLELPVNLGFGGGSNAGVRAARNDTVVLLNSDMRVSPDFLGPLLEGFTDSGVFAVSCQIFFGDPNKVREETGLTQGWWQDGGLRVRHRVDPAVDDLFPCFYGGGGSCAFDRRKFLELGGFDPLYEPFYLEDADLGYLAWKRGWKVLYQPRSVVFHEHRGSIGKRFGPERIQATLKKNYLLFCWKNVHEWRRLAGHFFFSWAGAALAAVFGDVPLRPNAAALWDAFRQLPGAVRSRRRARSLARVSDTEAFRRPLGGYFRDRFASMEADPVRPRVLLVSPYPICPPVHGGAVFMYQTLCELSRVAETHVVAALDDASQAAAHEELRGFCASAEWTVRPRAPIQGMGSLAPYAVREIADEDLGWLIHRQLYRRRIDALQLEYTTMAQYRGAYRRIAVALFEHDVYFQSVARNLAASAGGRAAWKARYEYLRALRYELRALPQCDQVQVCTETNRDYLLSYLPKLAPKLRAGLRAGIDAARYDFRTGGREPFTMLFLGSFRHLPNLAALDWFVGKVMPLILARRPEARLAVAGSDPPPAHAYAAQAANLDMLGFVEDARDPLARYAVFVCPVLGGSGVRVKLLEAFAAGIPAVSTKMGAEGLAKSDGEFCRLADEPAAFAARVLELFDDPLEAAAMARRARAEVEANWDMPTITRRLAESYRSLIREKRRGAGH